MLLQNEPFSNTLCLEKWKKLPNNLSWPVYTNWIEKLSQPVSTNALHRSVLVVESRRRIARNVHRVGEISYLRSNSTPQIVHPPPVCVHEHQTDSVNMKLAVEINELKVELAANKQELTIKVKPNAIIYKANFKHVNAMFDSLNTDDPTSRKLKLLVNNSIIHMRKSSEYLLSLFALSPVFLF